MHTDLGWPVFAADEHLVGNINWWGAACFITSISREDQGRRVCWFFRIASGRGERPCFVSGLGCEDPTTASPTIREPTALNPRFPHLGSVLCFICNSQSLPSTIYGGWTHGVHGGNGEVHQEIPVAKLGHLQPEFPPRDGDQARPCLIKSWSSNFLTVLGLQHYSDMPEFQLCEGILLPVMQVSAQVLSM